MEGGEAARESPPKESRKSKRHRAAKAKDARAPETAAPVSSAFAAGKVKVEAVVASEAALEPHSSKGGGVFFDLLEESSTSNEENTEAEEEIGPLRSIRAPLSTQSSYEVTDMMLDPSAHTPNMS